MAVDPKGRAILLGAIEKNKLAFLTSKGTAQQELHISSPLEASIPHQITLSMIGLDVEYENPIFVAIEIDYGDQNEKKSCVNTKEIVKSINVYEIDLGLNQIVRRQTEKIPLCSRELLFVPKLTPRHPSFILVCDDCLIAFNNAFKEDQRLPLPIRVDRSLSSAYP